MSHGKFVVYVTEKELVKLDKKMQHTLLTPWKRFKYALHIAYRHTLRSGRYDPKLFLYYFKKFVK